ncbi:MAG: peptidase M28 [Acidobacteria bacterium]|nr:MAG: peptidase M28 [Acidobacteriota bacterium]
MNEELRMTRRVAVALLLAASLAMTAAPDELVDYAMMTRIREEGFSGSKVMDTLFQLTDVIGARLTGSPNLKRANQWTREQLASWGLANAHLESWGPFGRGWSFDRSSVRMVSPVEAALIAYPKAWTPGTDGAVRGKAMKVKLESEADFDKLRGRIAGAVLLLSDARELKGPDKPLFTRYSEQELDELAQFQISRRAGPSPPPGQPPFDREAFLLRQRFQRPLREFLKAEKVLATLEPSNADGGIVRVAGGGSRQKDEDPGVTALVMAAEHYNRLARLVDRGLPVELELDVQARFHDDDANAYNTVAEIPGTDKKGEVVMLGAHMDSWHSGTGATDNAAGCAVAMEAVRILEVLGVQPRRTIRIALWTGEEQGLLGSRAYVRQHFASRPEPPPAERELPSFLRRETGPLSVLPEHAKLSAYFNLDNGTGKSRGIYTQGNAAAVPVFEAWFRPFADLGAHTLTNRTTGGTDHVSFDAVGLPGFQFIQDEADYETRTHHTNMDVYDRIQRDDMMQAAVIMAAFAYDAATREAMFPRKPMPRESPSPSPSPTPSPRP